MKTLNWWHIGPIIILISFFLPIFFLVSMIPYLLFLSLEDAHNYMAKFSKVKFVDLQPKGIQRLFIVIAFSVALIRLLLKI